MISDFIPSNEPVCDKCVVGVIQRRVVRHFDRTAVRIFAVREELVYSVQCVRLDGIVCRKYNELRYFGLGKDTKSVIGAMTTVWAGLIRPISKNKSSHYITQSPYQTTLPITGIPSMDLARECELTGCSPPGGFGLAQLQLGNLHLVGSQE
jgi:hypothetical protein